MLEIGSLVDNKYRVLDVVGRGGMSTVYLARNEKANKSWAIKEVLKEGHENLEIKKNSLIAETEMLKKLNHPNLPAIIDVIETEDTYLVVMDYIEGNDLDDIIKEYGAQPQEKVVEWGIQLCDVLGYLHHRKPPIIYRDLKPANIMLKPDGNITLIDFGTAREAEIKDVANTVSLGTRGYAAPEQFGDGARADARTDIYCFGATLYHLVTGHSPAEEPYIIQPIREINESLSGGLEKIILKCTMADPAKRYQDCDELMYDLEHYQEIDEAYRHKQKRKLGLFIGCIVLSIICFITSVVGYRLDSKSRQNDFADKFEDGEYFDAIQIDPTQKKAYLSYLDQIAEDNISAQEEQDLGKLVKYRPAESDDNKYYLYELAEKSTADYVNVCNDIGSRLLFEYETEDTKSDKAAYWFKLILPSDYADIDIADVLNNEQSFTYDIEINGGGGNVLVKTVTVGHNGDIETADFVRTLSNVRINDCKAICAKYLSGQTTDSNEDYKSFYNGNEFKNACVDLWSNLQDLLAVSQTVNVSDATYAFFASIDECQKVLDKYCKHIIDFNSISREQMTKYIQDLKSVVSAAESDEGITSVKEKTLQELEDLENNINNYYNEKQ